MTTNSTTTDAKTPKAKAKTKLHATTLRTLREKLAAFKTTTDAADAAFVEAEWQRFTATVDAHSGLGTYVLSSIAPKLDEGQRSGESIAKAFKDEASPIFVATDDRDGLPSASVLSRSMDVSRLDSGDRRERFKAAGNSPKLQDYILWAKLDSGETLGGKSTVDVAQTVKDGKAGKLVRTGGAPKRKSTEPTAPTVVGFFVDLMSMSGEDLDAIVTEGPADLSAIPEGLRRDIARQLMASVVRAEMSEKITLKV